LFTKLNTHLKINQRLCGIPTVIEEGFAQVELVPTADMSVDDVGLIHGGFIFGLADYAAMLAVNDPHVVLGGAVVKFLKPVAVDEPVTAEATVVETQGRKHVVHVSVKKTAVTVFDGQFTCFVLDKHVLST